MALMSVAQQSTPDIDIELSEMDSVWFIKFNSLINRFSIDMK